MYNSTKHTLFFPFTMMLMTCGIGVRLYLWFYHKDFWLDEALLAVEIEKASLVTLLLGHITDQSAPLLFLLLAKVLQLIGFFDEHSLYIFPMACGILTIVVIYKISLLIKGELLAFFSLIFFLCSYAALYYSSEFKQYSCEMLISCMYLYLFVQRCHFLEKKFNCVQIFFFVSLFLLSSSSIFSFLAFVSAYVFGDGNSFAMIKKRLFEILPNSIIILLIFIIYYYFFLSHNKSIMDEYWKQYFIPLNPFNWPSFIYKVAYPVFLGLTGEKLWEIGSYFSFVLAITFPCGLILMYKHHNNAFCFIFCQFFIICTAMFFIYPVGHSGFIGSRLVLFLLPAIVLTCGYFFDVIFSLALRFFSPFTVIIKLLFLFITICIIAQNISWANAGMGHHQVSSLIKYINVNYQPGEKVAVYVYEPYHYYQYLNKVTIEPEVLYTKKQNVRDKISNLLSTKEKIYVLFSTYWDNKLQTPEEFLEEKLKYEKRNFTTINDTGARLYIIDKMTQ